MKYIILRNFLSKTDCNLIIQDFNSESGEKTPLNLVDGHDKTNTVYKSKRSKNLSYKYIDTQVTRVIQKDTIQRLEDILNIEFTGSINDKCLPVFAYGNNGEIKAHRGVQKSIDTQKYQSFVAVCQLTQRGVDFEEGFFYVNPKASASVDGKTVFNDLPKDRIYPQLNKGDICVFYNPSLVHGVETVKQTKNGNAFRVTCSWRSNNEQ